ncbi:MAG TPA: polysaccharide deacetylase family protein [Thermoanaerobaculia bacterium]|nr:polysaccharide deacetylase family protein [Thermoanaerobaculia bacterium]
MASAPSSTEAGAAPRPWRPGALLVGSAFLHGAGLAAAVLEPRLRPAVAALLIADHALLMGSGLWPTSRVYGPNLSRLDEGVAEPGGPCRVALTFDDGPDPEVTPRVLDLLDRRGGNGAGPARATFFCVGERVRRHPDLAAEIARRGHRVENHTHRHLKRFAVLGPRAMAREIDRAQGAIAEVTGRAPRLVRPPAGFRNPFLDPLLARRGLWLVSWTRRAYDTVRSDPRRVVRDLTRGVEGGEILLLHDGGAARTRSGRPVVLEALPRVLDHLAAAGLQAVPVEAPG